MLLLGHGASDLSGHFDLKEFLKSMITGFPKPNPLSQLALFKLKDSPVLPLNTLLFL